MSFVSISCCSHLRRRGQWDVSSLKDEHTYVTVLGTNGYSQSDDLKNLKEITKVLYISPKAINKYHGGTELRQTLVVFEKKCQETSAPSLALGVSKEVTTQGGTI